MTKLKTSSTKDKLMDAAQTLVLEKGFVGTTVDDICGAAGLTKGSFFHYFDSKDKLGLELLKRYCSTRKESLQAGCGQDEKDPLRRVYNLLDCIDQMAMRNFSGCLLGGMAQEMSDTHSDIRNLCSQGLSEVSKLLADDLAKAKKMYAPKAGWDPRSVGDYFVAVMQGLALVGKVKHDPKVMVEGVQHFRNYLKHLFGR